VSSVVLTLHGTGWLCFLAVGKTGGGFQGREVKTKATKKKYLGRDKDEADSDHDEETESMDNVFMSRAEIANELRHQATLAECSSEFTDAVASHLYRYVLHKKVKVNINLL